jgi:succinyl-diaminopimelate desuccinylase
MAHVRCRGPFASVDASQSPRHIRSQMRPAAHHPLPVKSTKGASRVFRAGRCRSSSSRVPALPQILRSRAQRLAAARTRSGALLRAARSGVARGVAEAGVFVESAWLVAIRRRASYLDVHSHDGIMTSTDTSFDRALAFAQDLIRIPSPPGNEGEVAARVMREMIALGLHDVHSDDVGNVIGVAPGRGAAPPILLCSHLDTVDVGDIAMWQHPPYGAVIDGGYLHGRGAMDIKGPLAVQTYTAAQFIRRPAAGDVVVAHTVLEERGGWGMAHLMATGTVKPAAIVIGEATNGDICIGHRGRAEIIIEVRGLAGHASAPHRARNPLAGIGTVLAALDAFAHDLEETDVLGRSTAAPTMVETLPRSRNVIPDVARIVLDWRVLPGVMPDDALARVQEYLGAVRLPADLALDVRFGFERQRTWTGIEEERRLFTPGFLLDAAHPVVRAAARCVTRVTGRAPTLRPWTFATDGGHSCGVHGIPTIGYAPGEERFAHTNRERLSIADARMAYHAYPSVLEAIFADGLSDAAPELHNDRP